MAEPTQKLDDELASVLDISDGNQRIDALIDLAPRLSQQQLALVLESVPQLVVNYMIARALAGLAPYLSEPLLNHAVLIADGLTDHKFRNSAYGVLGPRLSPDERTRLINIVKEDLDPNLRLNAWTGLIEYLSPDLKQEAVKTALGLTDEQARSEVLKALAPHLPDVWQQQLLDSASQIRDPLWRTRALEGLIEALPRASRAQAVDAALEAARLVANQRQRAIEVLRLYSHVPDILKNEILEEALGTADSISSGSDRVMCYSQMASMLPEDRLPSLFENALTALTDIALEQDQYSALLSIAYWAPANGRERLLEFARRMSPSLRPRTILHLNGIFEELPTTPEERVSGDSDTLAAGRSEQVEVKENDGSAHIITDASIAAPGAPHLIVPRPEQRDSARGPASPSDLKAEQPDGEAGAATAKDPAPASPTIPHTEPDETATVATYLHSDRWTLDDQLNYSLYAKAIAEFIYHSDTHPPLTIGVLAPWGQGKTTLMNLIRFHLYLKANNLESGTETESRYKEEFSKRLKIEPPQKPVSSFGTLREWLSTFTTPVPKKLKYPTVWFNAWKYQNSEQVWAGMAHTILSQLVDQIESPIEREKFWLALQAERIDFNAIRKDIHRLVFEQFAPKVIKWILFGIAGVLLFVLSIIVKFDAIASFITSGVLGAGGCTAIVFSLWKMVGAWREATKEITNKPLEGKFAQYVRQPNYEGKLGFFHEVEQDVRRVFDLLVEEQFPLVVFVDDLDRCSPGTVAQVIEAMNLFLSGDFPNCFFVVGMDAQVVAASMEVAYANLDQRMRTVTRSYGSLGWYFLDKFIQLQFCIPNMTGSQRSTYLHGLFGQTPEGEAKLSPQALDQVEQQVQQKLDDANAASTEIQKQGQEVAKLIVQRPTQWKRLSHQMIEQAAKKLTDDSPDLRKYLKRYEPSLGSSPRTIKRFANLYRFYSLTQLSRESQGLPSSSVGGLARWLVIMLRWPQLVRWIQWEGEARLGPGTNPLEKATSVEDVIAASASFEEWIKQLSDADHIEWLNDKQLYQFLRSSSAHNERLSKAVETGVW